MKQVCFNVKSSRLIIIDGRLKVVQTTKKDAIKLEMYYLNLSAAKGAHLQQINLKVPI